MNIVFTFELSLIFKTPFIFVSLHCQLLSVLGLFLFIFLLQENDVHLLLYFLKQIYCHLKLAKILLRGCTVINYKYMC